MTEQKRHPMEQIGLNPDMLAVKDFIRDYIKENGYSPTLKEICKGVGKKSEGNMSVMIHKMVERGHLLRPKGTSRSVVVID